MGRTVGGQGGPAETSWRRCSSRGGLEVSRLWSLHGSYCIAERALDEELGGLGDSQPPPPHPMTLGESLSSMNGFCICNARGWSSLPVRGLKWLMGTYRGPGGRSCLMEWEMQGGMWGGAHFLSLNHPAFCSPTTLPPASLFLFPPPPPPSPLPHPPLPPLSTSSCPALGGEHKG